MTNYIKKTARLLVCSLLVISVLFPLSSLAESSFFKNFFSRFDQNQSSPSAILSAPPKEDIALLAQIDNQMPDYAINLTPKESFFYDEEAGTDYYFPFATKNNDSTLWYYLEYSTDDPDYLLINMAQYINDSSALALTPHFSKAFLKGVLAVDDHTANALWQSLIDTLRFSPQDGEKDPVSRGFAQYENWAIFYSYYPSDSEEDYFSLNLKHNAGPSTPFDFSSILSPSEQYRLSAFDTTLRSKNHLIDTWYSVEDDIRDISFGIFRYWYLSVSYEREKEKPYIFHELYTSTNSIDENADTYLQAYIQAILQVDEATAQSILNQLRFEKQMAVLADPNAGEAYLSYNNFDLALNFSNYYGIDIWEYLQ